MKSKFKLLTFLLAIAIMFSVFSVITKAYATSIESSEGVSLTATPEETKETPEIHEGDLYVFFGEGDNTSQKYVMDKYVSGNVFIFANEVEITGRVDGALFVCANKITISDTAEIASHIYAAGQEITMSGFTYDMYAAAEKFEMTDKAVLYRDIKLAANDIVLRGTIVRNVDLTGNKIDVYESESKNLYVGGNFNYSSAKEIEHINDITVKGKVNFTEEKEEEPQSSSISDYVFDAIQNTIFTIAVLGLLLFLAPKFVEKSKEYISTRGLLAGAIGLAFVILVPVVAFILLITFVGLPIAFASLIVYVLVFMLNSAIVSIALNEFIASKVEAINSTWKKLLMIIPVSLVLFVLEKIPFVGGWVSAIVFLVGIGIIVLYQFDRRKKVEE